MASVRKREWTHNGVKKSAWVVEYTDPDTGGRRRFTPKSGLKKDAEKERIRIESEIEQGDHTASSSTVTVSDAIEDYIRACECRARRKDDFTYASLEMFSSALKRVRPIIGQQLLTKIDHRRLQSMAEQLTHRYKPRTVRHTMSAVSRLLDHAVFRGWIKRNVYRDTKIRLPSVEGRLDIPSKDELRKIIEVTSSRIDTAIENSTGIRHAIVCLAMFGGLRRGEICGLQWKHVDLDGGQIYIRQSFSRTDGVKSPKSKAGVREVPISIPIEHALRRLLEGVAWDAEAYVIQNRSGRPLSPNNISLSHWPAIARAAGLVKEDGSLKYTFHSLRHAAVSLLIDAGLSPMHTKTVIGHASVSTTMNIYAHLFPDDNAITNASHAAAAALLAPTSRQRQLEH